MGVGVGLTSTRPFQKLDGCCGSLKSGGWIPPLSCGYMRKEKLPLDFIFMFENSQNIIV